MGRAAGTGGGDGGSRPFWTEEAIGGCHSG
jgi:hypothetical protein